MVPERPDASDYPAAWWQTLLLFTICGLVFFLAAWGGIDIAITATSWLDG